ncbi:hypothetical protein BK640_06900 [Pseudomonas protegens]|nr:hypothetical protein BK640_06900 [Pseudomonas protegens]
MIFRIRYKQCKSYPPRAVHIDFRQILAIPLLNIGLSFFVAHHIQSDMTQPIRTLSHLNPALRQLFVLPKSSQWIVLQPPVRFSTLLITNLLPFINHRLARAQT